MNIAKISLHNYRCYKDLQLAFPVVESNTYKNIILFSGKTGSGKTSLLNAIGWCLTGKESQELLDEGEHKMPIIGSYCDIAEDRHASVELRMRIANGNESGATIKRTEYYLARTFKPYKDIVALTLYMQDGTSRSYSSENVDDTNIIDNYLKRLYPRQLSKFYIFDSEFMARAYSESLESVSSALKQMFRISEINALSTNLGQLSGEFRKEISKRNKGNDKMKRLDDAIGLYEKEVERLKLQLNEKQTEANSLQIEFAEVNSKIGSLKTKLDGIPDLEKVEERRKKLVESQNTAKTRIAQLQTLIAKKSIVDFPQLISIGRLSKALEEIKKGEEQGTLHMPPTIGYSLITELINGKKCICGRTIEDGSEEMQALEQLKVKAKNEGREGIFKDFVVLISYWEGQEDKALSAYSEDLASLEAAKKNLEAIEGQLVSLMEQETIGSGYEDMYKELEKQQNHSKFVGEEIKAIDGEKSKFASSLEFAQRNLDDAKADYKKEENKSSGIDQLRRQETIAEALQKIFSSMPTRLLEKFGTKMASNINSMVSDMPAMQKKFASIKTNGENGFALQFLDPSNETLPTYLTGGQSRIAGISIISAFIKIFSQISGYAEMPFISIDNPFSGMDKETLKLFYEKLGEFLSGTQAIIFVPDTAFEGFMANGKQSIKEAYWIENKGGNSEIREVDGQ